MILELLLSWGVTALQYILAIWSAVSSQNHAVSSSVNVNIPFISLSHH